MAILTEMADIFTPELKMTLTEILTLEGILLDAADSALSHNNYTLALDIEDAIFDLHILKRVHLLIDAVRHWGAAFPGLGLHLICRVRSRPLHFRRF